MDSTLNIAESYRTDNRAGDGRHNSKRPRQEWLAERQQVELGERRLGSGSDRRTEITPTLPSSGRPSYRLGNGSSVAGSSQQSEVLTNRRLTMSSD